MRNLSNWVKMGKTGWTARRLTWTAGCLMASRGPLMLDTQEHTVLPVVHFRGLFLGSSSLRILGNLWLSFLVVLTPVISPIK